MTSSTSHTLLCLLMDQHRHTMAHICKNACLWQPAIIGKRPMLMIVRMNVISLSLGIYET